MRHDKLTAAVFLQGRIIDHPDGYTRIRNGKRVILVRRIFLNRLKHILKEKG